MKSLIGCSLRNRSWSLQRAKRRGTISAIGPHGRTPELDKRNDSSRRLITISGAVGKHLNAERNDEIQEVASVGEILNIDQVASTNPSDAYGHEI